MNLAIITNLTIFNIFINITPKSPSSSLHRQNCHHHHHCIAKIVITIIIASPKLFAPRSPFTPTPLFHVSPLWKMGEGRGDPKQSWMTTNLKQPETIWEKTQTISNNLKQSHAISSNLKKSQTILDDNQSQRI